jgi:fumarate hydratase class I
MTEFVHTPMFTFGKEETAYRKLTSDFVSTADFDGSPMLIVAAEGLTFLAEQAFREVSHKLRPSHMKLLAAIFKDPDASENDRLVALEMIKNAVIAAEGEFPLCQDTGTAIVMGKKGQQVWTGCSDEAALSRGIFNAYTQTNLRYSQNAPLSMFDEKNTACNLPAQIELYATEGDAYSFLFIAKGGGSANKTYLYQQTKAVLNPDTLTAFVREKMKSLGTAACPPYHLAFVVGGTSAEFNLKTVKLASAGYLDTLPASGSEGGGAFRDLEMEKQVMSIARDLGIGAQFGGRYFCLDARVIRLPRHGASCPIGIGVSCSADRNLRAKITADGIFLEQLEEDPAQYLPSVETGGKKAIPIDLDRPMVDIRAELSGYPVATPLLLTGNIIVGRDIAHAKLKERMDAGAGLPDYLKNHIIYYAGPAKTPPGRASGSFGPTTAARMDPYVPVFQAEGASMVMLAKGNRSREVTESCQRHGGFYLGSIGGPAARLGKECITKVEVLEYEELGMEAIFMITVKDFPAFILVDDKGNDFFEGLL